MYFAYTSRTVCKLPLTVHLLQYVAPSLVVQRARLTTSRTAGKPCAPGDKKRNDGSGGGAHQSTAKRRQCNHTHRRGRVADGGLFTGCTGVKAAWFQKSEMKSKGGGLKFHEIS